MEESRVDFDDWVVGVAVGICHCDRMTKQMANKQSVDYGGMDGIRKTCDKRVGRCLLGLVMNKQIPEHTVLVAGVGMGGGIPRLI